MTRSPTTAPGGLVAGRYRLLSRLGGGGMGTVWLSRDELLGRQVAIKQVLPPLGAGPAEAERQRERALREGRIAARLSTPHAIAVYDVAVEDGQPWLVMEYLPSRSLAAVLAEDGLLRVEQVAQVGAQVADGLAATHAAGIVHRDVKPANILIGQGDRVDGLVKITDFGISHASGDVTLTQTGQITGTPAFLAPEVAQGEEPMAPSDVFSLGATLYTCLEGQPPFGMGDNALQLLHKVAGGEISPPRWSGAMTGPLLAMLAADPAERPTMREVRDDLARLAAGRDGDPTTVLMGRTTLRPGPRRPPVGSFPPIPAPTPLPDEAPRPEAPGDGRPGAVAGPAAAAAAAAAPGGAPAAPPEEPAAAPADGGRRRRRLLPVAIAAAVLAAVGALVAVLLTTGGSGATSAQAPATSSSTPPPSASATPSSSPSPSSAAAPTTSPAPPPTTTEPAPTTASSSTAPSSAPSPGPGASYEPAAFLANYHGLLPGDTAAAWALTGPGLRSSTSYADYQAFWRQFSAVRLVNVQVQGPTSATGELDYTYPDGSVQRELHRFTMTRGQDGKLLLDLDRSVQVLQSR